jgi:proteic killer suppression protein
MIKKFRHKGLGRFFLTGSVAGIQPAHGKRLQLILSRLDASIQPKDMDLPGLRLHELIGRDKGRWSVWVNGNWRVTFCFEGTDASDVDYEDYH